MLLFSKKLDPILKFKLKEKSDRTVPIIVQLKEPLTNRFKNSITKNGGKLKYEYKFMNTLAAQMEIDYIEKLSELPEVYFISYDRKAQVCMDKVPGLIGMDYGSPYNLTGRGINIALIDTGFYPHPELTRPHRVLLSFKDFVNSCADPYDDNGHGTHLSGIISGNGSEGNEKYKGLAPASRIIMLKAFNSVGEGSFSDIIAAIGWAIENKEKYNIKILCLPFGTDALVNYKLDPLCLACESAWREELIVIASSGNKGPHHDTITTPGISPSIITVGCCECTDSNIKNWKIPDFSGRGGKVGNGIKPDLIAPGTNVISLSSVRGYNSPTALKGESSISDNPYCSMTGSSVSAAVTAGCIALLMEKCPDMPCKDLKGVLKFSCQTLNEPKSSQGYGVINIKKLLNE